MLPSCSCYVDATLMGGVGWGGACYRHVHVTLMLRMRPLGYMMYIYIFDVYIDASGLVAPSRAFLEAPWEK